MLPSQLDGQVSAKEISESFKELAKQFSKSEKENKQLKAKDD